MSQLLKCLLSASVLMLASDRSVRPDEPVAQSKVLPAGAVSRLGTSRFLNFGRVFSVAFSPNGKVLAAGAWDGTVHVWEVASGKEIHKFHETNGPIRALAFSPDGKILACDGKDSDIVLRDALSGKELRRLPGHRHGITCVVFSPDGKLLASKGYDRTMRLWDVADGHEVRQIGSQDSSKQVNDAECPVTFARDGKIIISATLADGGALGSPQRMFRVWDVATGEELRSFQDASPWRGPVAISPDGKLLAAAAGAVRRLPAHIAIWDIHRGQALPSIDLTQDGHMVILTSLAFSPDGKTLASSDGGPIQLWEMATRREIGRFATPDTGASSLAFAPAGKLLASGSTDTTALLWDVTEQMRNGKSMAAKLSLKECQTLWDALGDANPSKARQPLWALVSGGDESVAFLRTQLHPVASPASPETIARLVTDLDSREFAVRSKASASLIQLAELAEPALLEAQKKHPALELRRRIDELLKVIVDLRTKPSGDKLRSWRAVEILEQIDTPQARQLLHTLSLGATGALLTREAQASLARMERETHPSPRSR